MLLKRFYSSSSKSWLSRQARDPYCKAAKANQYRARSAFKLVQIQEKYRIIRPNDVVIDCGAAPGGWTQVAAEKVSNQGLVIGIDLLPMDPFQMLTSFKAISSKPRHRKLYKKSLTTGKLTLSVQIWLLVFQVIIWQIMQDPWNFAN
ncbi:unnamed protein product [Rhizopus microsporus]